MDKNSYTIKSSLHMLSSLFYGLGTSHQILLLPFYSSRNGSSTGEGGSGPGSPEWNREIKKEDQPADLSSGTNLATGRRNNKADGGPASKQEIR